MPILFLLFVLVPIAEIALLIQVGGVIGGFTTIGIVILTAFLGTMLLRQQGLSTLLRAQQRMGSGEMPAQEMLEGFILVVGGVLLLTPGFLTDALGFCCLIPPSRRWLASKLARSSLAAGGVVINSRSVGGGAANSPFSDTVQDTSSRPADIGGRPTPPSSPASDLKKKKNGGDIIDGDYQRLD